MQLIFVDDESAMNNKPKIGVYVCHCGMNIAKTADVEASRVRLPPALCKGGAHYAYMCSDPGQLLIKEDIMNEGLTRVVVACSPRMHELTFRKTLAAADLIPITWRWPISGNIAPSMKTGRRHGKS